MRIIISILCVLLGLSLEAQVPVQKFRQLISFLPERLASVGTLKVYSPGYYQIPNTLHLYRKSYESLRSLALEDPQLEEIDADIENLAAIFFENGYLLRLKWAGGIAGCPQKAYVVKELKEQTWTLVYVCDNCMGFSRLQMRFIRVFNGRMEDLASQP